MDADQYRPFINQFGFCKASGWRLPSTRTRTWEDLVLWFMLEGKGSAETPEGRYPMEPGTCLLMRGGEDYTLSNDPGHGILGYFAHFHYLDGDGELVPHQSLGDPPRRWRCFPVLNPMADLLHRAWSSYNGVPRNPARANRWFEAVLMEVADFDRSFRSQGSSLEDAQSNWLRQVAHRIETNPQESFSIHALAAEGGYSRTYFYRLFRKALGVSPQQFAINSRMRHARSLLIGSNYTIAEISALCGYSDIYFFSRHFKQHHQTTPSAFRQKGGRVSP